MTIQSEDTRNNSLEYSIIRPVVLCLYWDLYSISSNNTKPSVAAHITNVFNNRWAGFSSHENINIPVYRFIVNLENK